MPTGRVITVIRTLVREPDDRPDGDLLTRFVAERDGAAFAELVRRHGRMVFGVCRRVLGHDHDAEDAFQAVWLVLARRAADVRPPGSVGPWLYGVAVRTAGKARALAMKRRRRQLAAAKPEAVEDRPACDLGPVLDEELARLPGRYRAAVVACDLGGKSRSVAARDLGWPEGTVAARLAKARQLLAARLSRRGVTLSAAALATAAAEPPEALAASAVGAALEFAAGSALVPPLARALAEGVMRSMIAGKVKLWVVGALVAATLAGGAVLTARPGAAPGDRPAPEPAPKQAKPSGEAWTEAKVIDLPDWQAGSLAYSPDGKSLAVGGSGGRVADFDTATWKERWKADVGGKFAAVSVSADGKTIAATVSGGVRLLGAADGGPGRTVKVKGDPRAVAFSPDGKWVATSSGGFSGFWALDDSGGSAGAATAVAGAPPATAVAWSPDSLYLAYAYPTADGPGLVGMIGVTPATRPRNIPTPQGPVTAVVWSRDGKTILTGDAGGTVIQWDWPTLKEKRRLQLGGRVTSLALTADGKRVAAAVAGLPLVMDEQLYYYEDVFVWPMESPPAKPTPIARHQVGGVFNGMASVAFSPDGQSLAASFCNLNPNAKQRRQAGRIRIWTLNTSAKPARKQAKTDGDGWKERKVLDLPGWLAGSLVYSPDGKSLAVGGSGGRVAVYETATWNNPWARVLGGKFSAVAYSWDGKTVAATVPDGVRLLSRAPIFNVPPPKDGTEKWKSWYEEQLTEKGSQPTAVAFFPETRVGDTDLRQHKVIFGSARGYFVKTWLEWPKVSTITTQTVPEGKQPADLYAVPLAADPHGKRVILTGPIDRATGKNVLWAWSAGSGAGNQLLEGHKAAVTAAAWSRDGKTILTGDTDGTVIQWDGTTFKEKRRLQLGGRVASLALTANGGRAAAAVAGLPEVMKKSMYYEDVFVWPTENPPAKPTPIARHQVGGVFNGMASVAFSPDGQSLAATFCNFDQLNKLNELIGKVRIWTRADAERPAPAKPAPQTWRERPMPVDPSDPFRGKAPFQEVAFAPDGATFAAARGDGQVILYDAKSLAGKWGYRASETTANGLSFSPDGTLLAIATPDGLRVHTEARPHNPLDGVKGTATAFAPDGRRIAVSDGATTRVITVSATNGVVAVVPGEVSISGPPGVEKLAPRLPAGVAWSPDGKRLALIRHEKRDGKWPVVVWGAGSGEPMQLLAGHTEMVHAVAWSKDGNTIATGGADTRLILWDGATFKELHRIRLGIRMNGTVHAVAFSPDGKTVAVGIEYADGRGAPWVVLIDVATGRPVAELQRSWKRPLVALAFSPDGDTLLVASGPATAERPKGDVPHGLTVWERVRATAGPPPVEPVWKERKMPEAPTADTWAVAHGPDGKLFTTAGQPSAVTVRDAATLKKLFTPAGNWPGFSADGSKLFTVGGNAIDIWDAATGKRAATKPVPKVKLGWQRVAFSPDGQRYAAFDGHGVRLFDVDTGFEPVRLDGQSDSLPGGSSTRGVLGDIVTFSADGRWVAGIHRGDGPLNGGQFVISVWDVKTGARLLTWGGNSALGTQWASAAFGPGGKTFAVCHEHEVRLFDTRTWKPLKTLTAEKARCVSVAISSAGVVAAGVIPEGQGWPPAEIRLWNPASGQATGTLRGLGVGAPVGLSFAPDGKQLVATIGQPPVTDKFTGLRPARTGSSVRVWELEPRE